MNDLVALQYAIFRGMRSSTVFADANVVLGRDYIARRIDMANAWLTPSKSGKQGIGLIVQVPATRFPKPNGLQRERLFGVAIYENPEDNWNPNVGTLRGADDWADSVINFLWSWQLWRSSGLVLEDHVTVEDKTYAKAGILGINAFAFLRQESKPLARAATPTIAIDGNHFVTLSVTDGSAIYYTTDGFSYPGPDTDGSLAGEQAAAVYSAPFQVAPGATLMAAAFGSAPLPSQTAVQLIT